MGDGVYIQSRQNVDLFTNILVRELLFADDSALIAHSAELIERIVDAFSTASSQFGLKININKTDVMFQPNSTTVRVEDINVDYTTLNRVQECTSQQNNSKRWPHCNRARKEIVKGQSAFQAPSRNTLE